MKNFIRIASIAGLLALSGAAAFAQSELKANIPFGFQTPGGREMPAGPYVITELGTQTGVQTYRILNMDTHQAVAALASDVVRRPAKDTNNRPVLTFKCAGEVCGISGIFRTGSQYGAGLRVHLKNVDPTTQIAEIAIPFGE